MKLSPLDIRKHEFARRLRGYDQEEVRLFLEMLSQQWDEVLEERRHAQDRVREMEAKISHYEKVEEALQEALQSAKSSAQRTQTHAEDRAKLIVDEAELRAEQILRDAEQERFKLRQDVSRLTHRHAEVTARLRHFLMSELEVLAQHEDERPVGFMKLIPAREAETAHEPRRPRIEHGEGDVPRPTEHREDPAQEAEPHDPSGDADLESSEDAASTTYADLYARAARRSENAGEQVTEPFEEDLEADYEDDPEPAWSLRQIVGEGEEGEDDDFQAESDFGRAPSNPSEREHIRRIIEDLD